MGKMEKINAATGEVIDEGALLVSREAEIDVDALMTKDVLEKTKRVQNAKDSEFKKTEADFWKPEKKGDELRGVYLGSQPGKRMMVHFFAKLGEKGKPVPTRVNGTTILTRELKKIEPGTPVRLVYQGEGKTEEGYRLALIEVFTLDL